MVVDVAGFGFSNPCADPNAAAARRARPLSRICWTVTIAVMSVADGEWSKDLPRYWQRKAAPAPSEDEDAADAGSGLSLRCALEQ